MSGAVGSAPAPPPEFTALSLVTPSRAVRKLVIALAVFMICLPPLLLVVPWQQNIPAKGRVTALNPLERTQSIPAPVTGRLVRVLVLEGAAVKKGDLLVEMSDQDPLYAQRLEQQYQLAIDKVRASRDQVAFYTEQLAHQEEARRLAVATATFELNVAREKVRAEEQALEAALADKQQKEADWERRKRLFAKQVVSELDYQKAEADYRSAVARVEGARARVEQARGEAQAREASIGQVGGDLQARLESVKSAREEARSKLALAEKELTDAETAMERQKTRLVTAPRDGRILRIHAAARADLIKQGEPLIELVPSSSELAVELWVRGNDAPLIEAGRKVRLQFEGWPAVQFSGWPSVAVGTFGGQVLLVDAQDDGQGNFRILVVPDPDDEPWPDRRYLRQGVRTSGWVLLDQVALGYEVWRQLNGFPPSVRSVGESQDTAIEIPVK